MLLSSSNRPCVAWFLKKICSFAIFSLMVISVMGCDSEPSNKPIAKKTIRKKIRPKKNREKRTSVTNKNSSRQKNKDRELINKRYTAGAKLTDIAKQVGSTAAAMKPKTIKDILKEAEDEGFPHLGRDKRPGERFITKIDQKAIAAAGIARIQGKHLTLYTDTRITPAIEELPQVFDQAVPKWCKYFGVDPKKMERWHINAFLMQDQALFRRHELLTDGVPQILLAGYAHEREIYINEIENRTDYFRRHLLIHEGTHSFMNTALGNTGAPWYSEGLAEYFGTHRWAKKQLTMKVMPRSKSELPGWGRIQLIQNDIKNTRVDLPKLLDVITKRAMPANNKNTEHYAWCWALVYFLDNHPDFQNRFRQLVKHVHETQDEFNKSVTKVYKNKNHHVAENWQLFAEQLIHGYDLKRTTFDSTPAKETVNTSTSVQIKAEKGWQNSGYRLSAGNTYQISAAGKFKIAEDKQTWWSEPGGVTIRYYHGQPLGKLLAVVRPDHFDPKKESALLHPHAIGLTENFTAKTSGTLFLKLNDSPAELHDNGGSVNVKIQKK